jgi:hypothetical protein
MANDATALKFAAYAQDGPFAARRRPARNAHADNAPRTADHDRRHPSRASRPLASAQLAGVLEEE